MKPLTAQEIAERNATAQKILDKIFAEDKLKQDKIKKRQKELEDTAEKPLTREEFDLAATEAGFRVVDIRGYHVAVCDKYIVFPDCAAEPGPCCVGGFYGSGKPCAHIATELRPELGVAADPSDPLYPRNEFWFYDYAQCEKAFKDIAELLNKYLETK
jgi:hypothetical protein